MCVSWMDEGNLSGMDGLTFGLKFLKLIVILKGTKLDLLRVGTADTGHICVLCIGRSQGQEEKEGSKAREDRLYG